MAPATVACPSHRSNTVSPPTPGPHHLGETRGLHEQRWLLITLRGKLVKIGAKVVGHGRYVTFQMAEVAVPRRLFAEVLWLIGRRRAPPAPT